MKTRGENQINPAPATNPPDLAEMDENRERFRLLVYLCLLGIIIAAASLLFLFFLRPSLGQSHWYDIVAALQVIFFLAIAFGLACWKKQNTAAMVLTGSLIVTTTYMIFRWEGPYAHFPIHYVVAILVAAIFLGLRASILVTALCIAVYSVTVIAQLSGWTPKPPHMNFQGRDISGIGLIFANGTFIAIALLAEMFHRIIAARGRTVAKSEQRYRELVESAPDMIINFNRAGKVAEVNKRTCEILGYERRELIGKTGADLVSDEDAPAVAAYFTSLMKTGAPTMIEVNMKDREGRPIPVEVNHTVIKENGKAVGMRAIARDVSTRIRLQEEQNKLREQLILSEKLAGLGQLVLGISHEYNNILAGLRGLAEVAKMPNRREALDDLPTEVINIVDRAQQVTRNLLGFAQRFEPSMDKVLLAAILNDVLRLTSAAMSLHRITVKIDVPADLSFYSEAAKLQEVLLNLFINAQQAMREGGTLTVSASTDQKFARIVVSDTGCGIAPENLSRIFDPFFTTKGPIGHSDQPGTGLGLSLSYGIIQSLGGDISVESEVGKGSTFTVLIPIRTPEAILDQSAQTKPATEPASTPQASRRVLVIEDEAAVRETLVEFLCDRGYRASGAADGPEGLGALEKEAFDVAFVDVFMPGMSGGEFIMSAHKRRPELGFVIITGRKGSLEDQGFKISELPNIISVLQKPFPYEKAVEIIGKAQIK